MGTPNVSREYLTVKLTEILRRPEYAIWLQNAMSDNLFYAEKSMRRDALEREKLLLTTGVYAKRMKFDAGPSNAAEFAAKAVQDAFGEHNRPNLLDPVQVTEIVPQSSAVRLYRVYDGNSAGTLGRWWCDAGLLQEIVGKVGDLSKPGAHEEVMHFIRSAMFVHPARNEAREISRMTIDEGVRLPVIVGQGCWKAMKSPESKDGKFPAIKTAADLLDHYGMVGIPGRQQTFVPLVPGMRVTKIPRESRGWPFYFDHELNRK